MKRTQRHVKTCLVSHMRYCTLSSKLPSRLVSGLSRRLQVRHTLALSVQELKEERQRAATMERQMHELEASSGATQVQAAELAGLRDRVTTLTTQVKVGNCLASGSDHH